MTTACPLVERLEPDEDLQSCTLALGNFWHPQNTFQLTAGVEETIAGYTGGKAENPTYRNI